MRKPRDPQDVVDHLTTLAQSTNTMHIIQLLLGVQGVCHRALIDATSEHEMNTIINIEKVLLNVIEKLGDKNDSKDP